MVTTRRRANGQFAGAATKIASAARKRTAVKRANKEYCSRQGLAVGQGASGTALGSKRCRKKKK